MSVVPTFTEDLFAPEVMADPYPAYRRMRDVGPVVLLGNLGIYGVGRYENVRRVLTDAAGFQSGRGVFFSEGANQMTAGTMLASDGDEHARLRKLLAHRLTPRAVQDQAAMVEAKADALVTALLERGGVIDAVPDIARAMPLSVVPDFVGFPQDCRDRVLDWAFGALDSAGPASDRTAAGVALAIELGQYTQDLVARRSTVPGSLGEDLLAAADRGEVSVDQCPALMIDYFGPALETTVSALGSAVALFATHPDQWDLLRADPSLAGAAFNEVLRCESPLRAFTRTATQDVDIDGFAVAEGSRIAVFFASANHDERKWDRPEVFDITRSNADHLALGYGVHSCAGQGLSRLEITAVLTRLARSVARIEPAGDFTRTVNALVRSHASIPVRMQAA
jgi:cytochrome P450